METVKSHLAPIVWEIAIVSLTSALIACAQSDGSLDTPFADPSVNERLCLTQVRSDRVEIVKLNGVVIAPGIVLRLKATKSGGDSKQLNASGFSWGRVSPDGSYVVGTDGASLTAITPAGDVLWQLTGTSVSSVPAVSADSRRIAFTTKERQLLVYDVAIGEMRRLNAVGYNPSWAPSGAQLAYDDGNHTYVTDLHTEGTIDIGVGTEPSWSSDGNTIAIRSNTNVIDAIIVHSRDRQTFLSAATRLGVPRWSPDGKWMVYSRRGARQWWSKAELTGAETSQIMVRNLQTGVEASVGEFFKGNPGDYNWAESTELCCVQPESH